MKNPQQNLILGRSIISFPYTKIVVAKYLISITTNQQSRIISKKKNLDNNMDSYDNDGFLDIFTKTVPGHHIFF